MPVERLAAALAAGIQPFGENRVQEAVAKAADLRQAHWHLVGHLQSNKAARAAELFEVIHSVDSVALAERLGQLAHDVRDGRPLPIYLQVNVDRDAHKEGFTPEEVSAAATEVVGLQGVAIVGLMTVGKPVDRPEDARQTFRRLRELSEKLRSAHPGVGPGLSMGMSDDFEIAVEEGATVVRVGRVLFGERPAL